VKECRYWINAEENLNCTFEAIANNGEKRMTLREIAKKLEISHVAVSYIEREVLNKIKTTVINEDF
jgi:DNA-directed RNA polymerase specialized sigma subunit